MTKKTNSVILRLGVSSFWKNKCMKLNSVWNKFQLESLLVSELEKIRLVLVSIIFESKLVQIFVYNDFQLSFSSQIKQFYNKKLNIGIIKNKLSCSERRIAFFIKKKKYHIFVKNKILLLDLLFKKYLRCCLRNYLKFHLILVNKLIRSFKLFLIKKIWKNNLKSIKVYCVKSKFRRKFGFIKLAFIRLYISILIFFVSGYFFKVWIRNILFSTGLWKNRRRKKSLVLTKKKGSTKEIRMLYFFLLTATVFYKSSLIGQYLAFQIKKFKNHLRILRNFTNMLEKLYYNHRIKFNGIIIRATGKLGGKMRKSKYHYKLGKANLQIIETPLSYYLGISATRFGIISIKIWLVFS